MPSLSRGPDRSGQQDGQDGNDRRRSGWRLFLAHPGTYPPLFSHSVRCSRVEQNVNPRGRAKAWPPTAIRARTTGDQSRPREAHARLVVEDVLHLIVALRLGLGRSRRGHSPTRAGTPRATTGVTTTGAWTALRRDGCIDSTLASAETSRS